MTSVGGGEPDGRGLAQPSVISVLPPVAKGRKVCIIEQPNVSLLVKGNLNHVVIRQIEFVMQEVHGSIPGYWTT